MVEGLKNQKVTSVAAGCSHSCVRTKDGTIYTFGGGKYGCLGIRADVKTTPALLESLSLEHIISIDCGAYHTMALTHRGDLYTFGDNTYGQLGIDKEELPSKGKMPNQGLIPTLTVNLILFWTLKGVRKYHSTGAEPSSSGAFCFQPTLAHAGVVRISAGIDHSAVVIVNGTVLTFGRGHNGQLGYLKPQQRFPKAINHPYLNDRRAISVSAGAVITAVHLDDGEVILFGKSPSYPGRATRRNSLEFSQNQSSGPGRSTSPAPTSRARSTMIFDQENGECEPPTALNDLFPLKFGVRSFQPAAEVAAGMGHTLVKLENLDVIAFGRGHEGQLGRGTSADPETYLTPTSIYDVVRPHIEPPSESSLAAMGGTAESRAAVWEQVCDRDSRASNNSISEYNIAQFIEAWSGPQSWPSNMAMDETEIQQLSMGAPFNGFVTQTPTNTMLSDH